MFYVYNFCMTQVNSKRRKRTQKNNVGTAYFFDTYRNVNTTILRLFLYVSEKSLFKILETGKLRLSLPWNTNDVTECVAQKVNYQTEGIKGFGYLCFSANPHSPAMWGLYADRSKGACLAFDFEVMLEKGTRTPVYKILDKGTYFYSIKSIHPIEYNKNRLPAATKEEEKNNTSFFFRKSEEWKHEREYRILYRLGDDKNVSIGKEDGVSLPRFYVDGLLSNLSAIMLGTRFPHEIEEVKAQLKEYSRLASENNSQLEYEVDNLNIMKVCFDDRSFAFKSEVGFLPSLKRILNDETLDFLFNNTWEIFCCERECDFTALTGKKFEDKAYRIVYKPNEVYYLAKEETSTSEQGVCLFRKKEDGEMGVIWVVHPNLLQSMYEKAMSTSIAERFQHENSARKLSPEKLRNISNT